MDNFILDFLNDHEWAGPKEIRTFYNDKQADEDDFISRQWVSKRITRLREHGHIERVHPDLSTYRLVSDPRDEGGDTAE